MRPPLCLRAFVVYRLKLFFLFLFARNTGLCMCNYLVGKVSRHFVVVAELHRVAPAGACLGREVRSITKHFSQWNLGLDDRTVTSHFHSLNAAAPAVQVAHEVAGEFLRPLNFDVHDRFQENRPGFADTFLEGQRAGDLERHFRRIDVVVRAVVQDHAEIDCRESCKNPLLPRFLNSFFDRWNKIPRNRTAEDFVYEFKVATARQWLHADFAITILAVTAALLLVLTLNIGPSLDRFTIWDLRGVQKHFHAVSLLQSRDCHFHVHLALARNEKLFGLGFARVSQPEVFIHELVDRRTDLFFVAA